MAFHDTSTKIIKESIASAVYIDDKVLLPFEKEDGVLLNQSSLYSSFRQNNCSLDFYRYQYSEPLDAVSVLLNKDLLILDWHLKEGSDDLSYTFDVLESAVKTQSLHFAVIYTDQKQEDLPQKVILNIASYFSGLTNDEAEKAAAVVDEFVDDSGLSEREIATAKNSLTTLTTELFFEFKDRIKNKEISGQINDVVLTLGSNAKFAAMLNSLPLPVDTFKEKLVCLSLILNKCEFPDKARLFKISLSPDRYTIRVDNLYIKVFSKDIKDANLYSEFTESLVKESNIFLTLLGLEIRNRFREMSGFIGKELNDLNQLAFFYHRKSHFSGKEDLFNDFLKEVWKDQVSSFLLERNIELFDSLDEFNAANGIDEKLALFTKADPKSVSDLAKLNLAYNRLSVRRKENDEIRFGDIFLLDLGTEKVHIMCLTPHCDCLRPEKIKNMFFFVEGTDIGMTKGVEKSDGDFISYLESEHGLTCIDWTNDTSECKPFSAYIPNNRMTGEAKSITLNYQGTEREAFYVSTLKENYTQRIANKAFFYPLRVGIDFATFKP